MAADYYLTIDGVTGESLTIPKAMEINGFDMGVTQPGSAASGTGLGTGKAKLDDFSFTIVYGKASPTLMMFCGTGKHIATATLVCRKAGGSQETYLTIVFKELIISSYKTNGPGGDEPNPTDTVTFNYTNISIDYAQQDTKTGKTASAATATFDVKTGKGSK